MPYAVRENKIKREIKILKTLRGLPNIIELEAVMFDTCSKCYSLVYPFVDHIDIRDIPDTEFGLPQIKKFTFQVLQVSPLTCRPSKRRTGLASCTAISNLRTSCTTRTLEGPSWPTGDSLTTTCQEKSTM